VDDDLPGGAPDDLPDVSPDAGLDDGPTAAFDEAAGVVQAAEALVEAAALEVDLDATAADLDGVDAALRRLDEGTYGTCEVCAADLADEALAADPTLRRCPVHVLARTLPGTGLASGTDPHGSDRAPDRPEPPSGSHEPDVGGA